MVGSYIDFVSKRNSKMRHPRSRPLLIGDEGQGPPDPVAQQGARPSSPMAIERRLGAPPRERGPAAAVPRAAARAETVQWPYLRLLPSPPLPSPGSSLARWKKPAGSLYSAWTSILRASSRPAAPTKRSRRELENSPTPPRGPPPFLFSFPPLVTLPEPSRAFGAARAHSAGLCLSLSMHARSPCHDTTS